MTISDIALKTGLSDHTLRYYEKVGIIPPVKRGSSGQRVFSDDDLGWIDFLLCLKSTGLSIQDIRYFISLCDSGDSTIPDRVEVLEKHREKIEEQINDLKEMRGKIDYKINYYKGVLKESS